MRSARYPRQTSLWKHRLTILPLLVLLPLFLFAQDVKTSDPPATNRTVQKRVSPRAALSKLVSDTAAKKIMILGTPHLNTIKGAFKQTALDSLLAALRTFDPGVIAIESLPPETIGRLEATGGNSSIIAEAFAERQLKYGHAMQPLLNTSWIEALAAADSLLHAPDSAETDNRSQQVAYLLAGYDYYSALLQWSYLPTEVRDLTPSIPDSIRTALTEDLSSANEIPALAVPLAKSLGHQRLFSVDDHYDDLMLLPISDSLSAELERHPLFPGIANAKVYKQSDRLLERANAKGNLLPYYRYLNSPEYMSADMRTQWGFFLRTHLPSGHDTYRFTLWEIRNLLIASNILKIVPPVGASKVLVIIGAAHKPFLDEYLGQMPDVRVVQAAEVLR
jgi:hypothetical protein